MKRSIHSLNRLFYSAMVYGCIATLLPSAKAITTLSLVVDIGANFYYQQTTTGVAEWDFGSHGWQITERWIEQGNHNSIPPPAPVSGSPWILDWSGSQEARITSSPIGSTSVLPISMERQIVTDTQDSGYYQPTFYAPGEDADSYGEISALFPAGNYIANVPLAAGGTANITMNYTGPATEVIPFVTNTSWQNGLLLFDPTQDFVLTWNSVAGFPESTVSIDLYEPEDGRSFFPGYRPGATTQIVISSGTFQTGDLIDGSIIFEQRIEDIASASHSSITFDSATCATRSYVSFQLQATTNTALINFASAMTLAGLTGPEATPGAAPHQDGVKNLLKYAFNMNLTGPDSRTMGTGGGAGLPAITQQGNGPAGIFRFEFVRRIGSGLIYTPKRSEGLSAPSWTPLTDTPTVNPIDAIWERVVYEEPVDPEMLPKLFGIVEISLP